MTLLDLKRGITFEDSDALLEWGRPVDELADTFNAKVENQGDRTLYNWGLHRVLNGLELDLINSFWNFGEEQYKRVFKSIEFWAIGDRPARENFDKISKHLTEQLGKPTQKNETADPEKTWIWRTRGALIHLHFFEQHVYKLCLTIEKE